MSYQINEIVQNPDGSLAYSYYDRTKQQKYLVSITEERYYEFLDAEEIFQFQFKIGSKWITDWEDYIYTIHSLFEDLKINYFRYNVESGERSMEDEYVRGFFYKDSEGNDLNFAEWFDLQIQTGKYKPFEEEEDDDDDEEPTPQEEPFPLSYGSMYVLANQNGAYRTNPNAYFFMKVLSTDFSEDSFTVRSYSEKEFSDVKVDKGDFLTAYANDEVKIYPFKEEDKISTCDDNGIPDFDKVFELTDIARGGTGETNFFFNVTKESEEFTNNLVITEAPYEIGGIRFNFIDYIDARILSGNLVVISEDERKDDEEEEEEQPQEERDIMNPPYLKSVNFYYQLRNTDKSVMRVLLGKNYNSFAQLLNESEKKEAQGDAEEGWYWWESTWDAYSLENKQMVIELDEKLLKAMFLIVKNNLEKFANDYYFTNFLYDRLGYLFKDMIINGLSYKYENAMVEENNEVMLFEIFPINEEEFLLYIYNQTLDDKWVSHVRYKESQKEIIITNLLKGASELTDLLIIEKIENYEGTNHREKTYFDDENSAYSLFEQSTMLNMMQNYVSAINQIIYQ
jgi:hypothetical protein